MLLKRCGSFALPTVLSLGAHFRYGISIAFATFSIAFTSMPTAEMFLSWLLSICKWLFLAPFSFAFQFTTRIFRNLTLLLRLLCASFYLYFSLSWASRIFAAAAAANAATADDIDDAEAVGSSQFACCCCFWLCCCNSNCYCNCYCYYLCTPSATLSTSFGCLCGIS